jgi:hypothetical protein
MYDRDLEAYSGNDTTWNQTIAMFVGIVALLGFCSAGTAWWHDFYLPNGRLLWIGLAVPSLLLAGSSVAFWRRSIALAIGLAVASLIVFCAWIPEK